MTSYSCSILLDKSYYILKLIVNRHVCFRNKVVTYVLMKIDDIIILILQVV